MKRGPRSGTVAGLVTYAQKAEVAWAPSVPDWIVELADHADRHGAKASGLAIGYSNAAISMVINGKVDKLDLERIEQAVRGAFMGLQVDCPVLGDIGRDRCLDEQRQPFRATSAMRAQLYHACRSGCPHFRSKGGDDGDL